MMEWNRWMPQKYWCTFRTQWWLFLMMAYLTWWCKINPQSCTDDFLILTTFFISNLYIILKKRMSSLFNFCLRSEKEVQIKYFFLELKFCKNIESILITFMVFLTLYLNHFSHKQGRWSNIFFLYWYQSA